MTDEALAMQLLQALGLSTWNDETQTDDVDSSQVTEVLAVFDAVRAAEQLKPERRTGDAHTSECQCEACMPNWPLRTLTGGARAMTDDIEREARDAFARDNFEPDWLMRRPGYEDGYLYGYRARAAEAPRPCLSGGCSRPATLCESCAARAAEQAKPEALTEAPYLLEALRAWADRDSEEYPAGALACDFALVQALERAGIIPPLSTDDLLPPSAPQQPSTRELVATMRQGIGNMQHDAWSKANEALTELEKRIGGE